MKKTILIVFCTLLVSKIIAQVKTETYQDGFHTNAGYINGTVTRSYKYNSGGKKQKHGLYKFSGSDTRSNSKASLKQTYTISASFKEDMYDGPITINHVMTGKYASGGASVNATNKLTGNFTNGKPNGTFNIKCYSGKWHVTATIKNDKFVGPFSALGVYKNSVIQQKGQFNQNGEMTGTWTFGDGGHYQFLNGVLIDGAPDVEEMGRQYAMGKITEEQLNDKGYFLRTLSISTSVFVNYLLDEDFNLKNIGGIYKLNDINYDKTYVCIYKLNTLTDEGLNLLLNEINNSKGEADIKYVGPPYKYSDVICYTSYEKESGRYFLDCTEAFGRLYGTTGEWNVRLFITPDQKKALDEARESIYIKNAQDFNYIMRHFDSNSSGLGKIIFENYYSGSQELKNTFMDFSDTERKGYIKDFQNVLEACNEGKCDGYSYTMSYLMDSTYIKVTDGNSDVIVYTNELEKVAPLLADLINWDNTVNQFKEFETSFKQKFNKDSLKINLLKGYELLLPSTAKYSERKGKIEVWQNLYSISDSLFMNNTLLNANFTEQELASYNNAYRSLMYHNVKNKYDYECFLTDFNNTYGIQKDFIKFYEKRTLATKKQNEIFANNEKIMQLSSTMKDTSKPALALEKSTQNRYTLNSMEDTENALKELNININRQQEMIDYLNTRNQIETMSINISSYLEETKKCAKAYAKLYDDLTLWNSKIDNYTKIKDSFNKIKKLNDNLNNLNLDVVCKKIKSAKNSEQIMEAFGL